MSEYTAHFGNGSNAAIRGSDKRVVIIDDDTRRRDSIARKLAAAGYLVDQAESKEVFRNLLRMGSFPRPHAVLMNTAMRLEPSSLGLHFPEVPVCVYGNTGILEQYEKKDVGFYGDIRDPVRTVRSLMGEQL